MGIKVLFLYPNTFGMNMLPPALALFSALLKDRGHSVACFDATYYDTGYGTDSDGAKMENLNVMPYDMAGKGITMRQSDWREEIRSQYHSFSPDLIAVSTTEDMWELATWMLDALDEPLRRDRIPVIVGGVFATFAPWLVLRHPLVTTVCVGEGETALITLCDRLEQGLPYQDVTNLCFRTPDGGVKTNAITSPVDVNAQPILDISLFEEARLYRPMSGKIYKMLPVETIRGCPYQCTFCNSPVQSLLYSEQTNSRFLRKKRMDLVYKELKYFKDELNIEYVYFWADTFLALSPKELDAFCEIYQDINLPFWMQTRPETVTEESIGKLADVGLNRISFGIEHGNEDFRRQYLGRKVDNQSIIEALRIPKHYGVQFSVNNITGFPYETRELAMDTVELNRHIESDNQNIYTFVPFHGTPLRETCEKMGWITPDMVTKCLVDKPDYEMPQYPLAEIEGLRKCFVLYLKFPKSRWPDIRRAEADTPEGNRLFEELKAECVDRYFS